LKVVGAGLPRTATRSLKAALESLLGGRCYHMHEVFQHLEDVDVWRAAARGT
jgi:Sulfotransferase domain